MSLCDLILTPALALAAGNAQHVELAVEVTEGNGSAACASCSAADSSAGVRSGNWRTIRLSSSPSGTPSAVRRAMHVVTGVVSSIDGSRSVTALRIAATSLAD